MTEEREQSKEALLWLKGGGRCRWSLLFLRGWDRCWYVKLSGLAVVERCRSMLVALAVAERGTIKELHDSFHNSLSHIRMTTWQQFK